MALWVDQEKVKGSLASFFEREKDDVAAFGLTVNQTFEAFVFASMVSLYKSRGWTVDLVHPKASDGPGIVRLKFNTRGRPSGYTYALCRHDAELVEVRHNLRVATRHHAAGAYPPANICLDVAVIQSHDLTTLGTSDHVENEHLVTFGEAKHMSAFAELVANFLGLVHEMLPERLESARPFIGPLPDREHLAPFLYVSGYLNPTAKGVRDSIRRRGLDVDVYDHESGATFGFPLSTVVVPNRPRKRAASGVKPQGVVTTARPSKKLRKAGAARPR